MSAACPKVEMIWTRALDGQPMAGRVRIARSIREVVRGHADVREHILADAAGKRGAGWALNVLANGFRRLGTFGLMPLQCSIYADPRSIAEMVEAIDPAADVIYLDGVRMLSLLEALRERFPAKRIVIDLDDLMSRRMKLLLSAREPLAPGHMASRMPGPLRRWLGGLGGRLVASYEALTLPRAERRVAELADALVLLSPSDMDELPPGGRAERVVIGPSVAERARATGRFKPGPLRFVFVGTDGLTQNRLTIDYLLEIWRKYAIPTPLVIFGIQTRELDLPANVQTAGYVESLDEIYDDRSVMLTPTFLRGGVKTKVLEAMSYGTPVIGNADTFEALPIQGYPLCIADEAELVAVLRDPESHRARLETGARVGLDYVRAYHGGEHFAVEWCRVLGLPVEAGAAQCTKSLRESRA